MSKGVKVGLAALAVVVAGAVGFGFFGVHKGFIDDRVSEKLTADGAIVASGAFHAVVHQGRGTATVRRHADGRLALQLSGFAIDNGPALEVWLVALEDATDSASVKKAKHLVVGPLRGNIGNQSYAMPAGYDPAVHRAVVVWCERFAVNFVTAPLTPGG